MEIAIAVLASLSISIIVNLLNNRQLARGVVRKVFEKEYKKELAILRKENQKLKVTIAINEENHREEMKALKENYGAKLELLINQVAELQVENKALGMELEYLREKNSQQ